MTLRSHLLTLTLGTTVMIGAASAHAFQMMSAPPAPRAPGDALLSILHSENEHRRNQLERQRRTSDIDLKGYQLSAAEKKVIRDLYASINSPDIGKAKTALAAAQPQIQSTDGKFVLGALMLQLAAKAQDQVLQSNATDQLLATGRVSATYLPTLYRNQASFALEANNLPKAEAAFEKLMAIGRADAETTVSLAQVKSNLGKYKEALPLFEKAIIMQSQAGKPVPEIWNKATRYARQEAQKGS